MTGTVTQVFRLLDQPIFEEKLFRWNENEYVVMEVFLRRRSIYVIYDLYLLYITIISINHMCSLSFQT